MCAWELLNVSRGKRQTESVRVAAASGASTVAAAQLDKTKVLCLKYRPQWICQYKDTKINRIAGKLGDLLEYQA